MTAKLTLGPLLFNWPAEKRRDFYFRMADESPVDTVCLGEVVCQKRTPFFAPMIPEVAERLQRAGKEVVISCLALVMDKRESEDIRTMAASQDFLVEANDMASVSLLQGRDFAVGPLVNVYNEGTVGFLAAKGAKRICLPVELPGESVALLAQSGLAEIEVQVFGRAPLAISARCYHARAHGLHKDGCLYVCGEDPDGMLVETLDHEPFLAVNGTQTLSYRCLNLAGELEAMGTAGVKRFRLSPHDLDMVAVARTFRDVLDGRVDPREASERLNALPGALPPCNGFNHGVEGTAWIRGSAAE